MHYEMGYAHATCLAYMGTEKTLHSEVAHVHKRKGGHSVQRIAAFK